MSFAGLYELSDYEIANLYKEMAENFYEDELYKTVFPYTKSRRRLVKYFFKHYLAAIRPYAHFVADDKALHSVMVVYDASLEIGWKYHIRLCLLNMKMVPMLISTHSFQVIWHVIKCWDMFTSRWVKEFVTHESYHIDLMYTKEAYRHQGLAKMLITKVCEEAKEKGFDVTLETHHKDNLALYEETGFKLMSVITHDNYDLKQYCLLIRNE